VLRNAGLDPEKVPVGFSHRGMGGTWADHLTPGTFSAGLKEPEKKHNPVFFMFQTFTMFCSKFLFSVV